MFRFIGKSTYSSVDIGCPQFAQACPIPTGDQLRKRGPGGDGRGAAAYFESRPDNAAIAIHECRKAQNVATDRIRDLHCDSGCRQLAHIARVPEVLDQFRAHSFRI